MSPYRQLGLMSKILSVRYREREKQIVTGGIALGTAENIEHFSDILGLMFLQNGVNINKSLNDCADKTKTDCAF